MLVSQSDTNSIRVLGVFVNRTRNKKDKKRPLDGKCGALHEHLLKRLPSLPLGVHKQYSEITLIFQGETI